ncbi:MAG: oligopeptide transport system ATP-binding protein [Candidatus Paceibacteria bacterium]|jgi:oligopeptide transport system ATP-binding protein
MSLLDVRDLTVRFDSFHGSVRAVDHVSFELSEGETLGLVGESGSGKSVTNLAMLGLIPQPPGVIEAGQVLFQGKDLLTLPPKHLQALRGNEISMIFQDPMTSLNPLLTVGQQLREVLEIHKGLGRKEANKRCAQGLDDVGIPSPMERLEQYPHELSGGMRQRVMIAMALLCDPKVLIADEPTTALDVTIQAQVLELMNDLQERRGTAIIMITHDLGVIAGVSDRVHVMYAGKLVETGPVTDLFHAPAHPYTKGLLSSVPSLESDTSLSLESIPGNPPDLAALPPGCAFEPRCSVASERCTQAVPSLDALLDPTASGARFSACPAENRRTSHAGADA